MTHSRGAAHLVAFAVRSKGKMVLPLPFVRRTAWRQLGGSIYPQGIPFGSSSVQKAIDQSYYLYIPMLI